MVSSVRKVVLGNRVKLKDRKPEDRCQSNSINKNASGKLVGGRLEHASSLWRNHAAGANPTASASGR